MKSTWLYALGLLVMATPALSAAETTQVTIQVSADQIDFLVGKALVGRYHKGPSVAEPYLWPLNGPGGVPLTRGWPMEEAAADGSKDHIHQKSAWFCHGDVIPDGIEVKDKIKGIEGVDFWSEAKGHGVIVCTHVGKPQVGKEHGQVTTYNEWRTADGIKVLDEKRTLHLYDFGTTRLLVFDIDLHGSVYPLTFGDTKEGSMGIRINDRLRTTKGGQLENAAGKRGEGDVWGYQAAWCDYSGPIDGNTVGLALLADPTNPYKSSWHSRGYGLMAANPFGRAKSGFPAVKGRTDLVHLAKGEHLKLRYGLLLHPGDAREGKVAEFYRRFVSLRAE